MKLIFIVHALGILFSLDFFLSWLMESESALLLFYGVSDLVTSSKLPRHRCLVNAKSPEHGLQIFIYGDTCWNQQYLRVKHDSCWCAVCDCLVLCCTVNSLSKNLQFVLLKWDTWKINQVIISCTSKQATITVVQEYLEWEVTTAYFYHSVELHHLCTHSSNKAWILK